MLELVGGKCNSNQQVLTEKVPKTGYWKYTVALANLYFYYFIL
jgi:hypothetical protein